MDKYLLYIETTQTSLIRNILDPVKGYFPDINLKVDNTGIRVFEMDKNEQSLLHLKLDANRFEKFYCPKEIHLGVSVLSLAKVFKNMDTDDVLVLLVEEKRQDFLTIQIRRNEHNTVSKVDLRLMDLEYEAPPNNIITFDSIIKMSSSELNKLCREFKDHAENIEIINIGDQLRFKCSNDRLCYEKIIGTNEHGIEYIKQDEPDKIIQGIFRLDYLVEFTKCANLNKDVFIHFQNDFPLVLQYDVGILGKIRLGISPKVEIED